MTKMKRIMITQAVSEDKDYRVFFLPSGYNGMVIQVFESAYEELESRLISTEEADKAIYELRKSSPTSSISEQQKKYDNFPLNKKQKTE